MTNINIFDIIILVIKMFENKKIFILGLARSGYNAAKLLSLKNNEIVLNDSRSIDLLDKGQVSELEDLGVKVVLGSHPDDILDSSFDYLIKNPGVPIDHKYVLKARELGVKVINEVEMAYHLLPKDITIIGITGTNGKTTTTTLTYEILKKAFGEKVHLAGNIGIALSLVVDKVKSGDILVMEVSCQQGENFDKFHPNIGLFTNLSPAHIDFMKSYEHYIDTKIKMFYNQESNDLAFINYEDELVKKSLNGIKSKIKYFSSKRKIDGCYLKDDFIYYYDDKIININELKIKGMHNVENVLGAISICLEFNVSYDVIVSVLKSFRGVEHRLEYVDTVNGVMFYNDTEATNIKCTQIALLSFNNPIIIFLGGLDRGQDFNELIPFIKNVKCILAIGEARDRVEEFALKNNIKCYKEEFLNDAFKHIKNIMESGDVVLLSPASASWDQYKECEIRGREFKDLVSLLKDELI